MTTRLRGVSSIDDALEGAVITAVVTQDVKDEKGIMDKFRQFVKDATSIIGLGKKLYEIYGDVQKYLPPPHH